MPQSFPLEASTPSALSLNPRALERLSELVTRHVAEGRYVGAQFAVARRGRLALVETVGDARREPEPVPARDDALWILADRGAFRFADRVADHVPGFEAHGKGEVTIIQLLTHRGGFPGADVPKAAWEDHDLLRRAVCAFTLEWTPGSRVHYHGRSAHWTVAVLIEALTKTDYR